MTVIYNSGTIVHACLFRALCPFLYSVVFWYAKLVSAAAVVLRRLFYFALGTHMRKHNDVSAFQVRFFKLCLIYMTFQWFFNDYFMPHVAVLLP